MTFDENYVKLPKVYKRAGKDCYLDPIRNKLIHITPEETVRQRVIQYLIETGVPSEMIDVEEHLSHYGINSNKRADIVVRAYENESNSLVPVMVVECKAPNVTIGYKEQEQVFEYADLIGADFVVVTNGGYNYCYHYNQKEDKYEAIENFPTYEELLSNTYHVMDLGEMPPRTEFDRLEEVVPSYLSYEIGENTPKDMQICLINFYESILDEKNSLPKKKYKLFKLIRDLGIRYSSYGNASGGGYAGFYRSFLIECNESTEIVSIGISNYGDTGKTLIIVAVDNEKTSHHALQLVVDDNCSYSNQKFYLYHHGKIAIGNIGSGKLDELREFVRKDYPSIISGNKYYLGELTNDRLWNLNDKEMVDLIENLISYALIRDEYREYKKAQNDKKKK